MKFLFCQLLHPGEIISGDGGEGRGMGRDQRAIVAGEEGVVPSPVELADNAATCWRKIGFANFANK